MCHKRSGSEDIIVLVCHMIKSLSVFMRGILSNLVAIGIDSLMVEIKWFCFVIWSWCDDFASTCFISFIWIKSCSCTCLPHLVVIGLLEMQILILISNITWIHRKNRNSSPRSLISRDFQSQNTCLELQNPWMFWQKTVARPQAISWLYRFNTDIYKELYFSRKHKYV